MCMHAWNVILRAEPVVCRWCANASPTLKNRYSDTFSGNFKRKNVLNIYGKNPKISPSPNSCVAKCSNVVKFSRQKLLFEFLTLFHWKYCMLCVFGLKRLFRSWGHERKRNTLPNGITRSQKKNKKKKVTFLSKPHNGSSLSGWALMWTFHSLWWLISFSYF